MAVDDVGRAYLIDSVKPLHPEEQTVAEMLQGWRNQQLSRNLQFETIDSRVKPPKCSSTGTRLNTPRTTKPGLRNVPSPNRSSKTSSTADDQVSAIAASNRKGWLPAYRDAAMFKIAYSYGLRFNELSHLQTVDFARNPHAKEFGKFGLVHVRYGKAKKGSPPKRRSVLTVFDWTPEILTDWLENGQPHMDDGLDLFPSERGNLVSGTTLLRRFRRYCDELDLSPGLDLHSLRRSYATHLLEAGWDAMFVQNQMGHEHASTTAIYTCVTSDYRTRTLRNALDATIAAALGKTQDGGTA